MKMINKKFYKKKKIDIMKIKIKKDKDKNNIIKIIKKNY